MEAKGHSEITEKQNSSQRKFDFPSDYHAIVYFSRRFNDKWDGKLREKIEKHLSKQLEMSPNEFGIVVKLSRCGLLTTDEIRKVAERRNVYTKEDKPEITSFMRATTFIARNNRNRKLSSAQVRDLIFDKYEFDEPNIDFKTFNDMLYMAQNTPLSGDEIEMVFRHRKVDFTDLSGVSKSIN